MIEAYIVTFIGVALAQSAPGPNFVAVVAAALGQSRRAAMFTVLGVSFGMMVWAIAIASGLAALIAVYPAFLIGMKIAGGSYLMFLGIKALLSARKGNDVTLRKGQRVRTDFANFQRGLLVVVTNPKAALMWSAVGAYLFGSGLNGWQVAAFGPLAMMSSLAIYGSYGLMFSGGMAARTYSRFSRWIETALGAVFGALGAGLLLSGIRDVGGRG